MDLAALIGQDVVEDLLGHTCTGITTPAPASPRTACTYRGRTSSTGWSR
jgi:hypothetical protein